MKWEVKIRHTEAEEWISLDLGDENPYITLQAFDVSEPSARNVTFSQALTLPVTETNIRAMQYFNGINGRYGDISTHAWPCLLLCDGQKFTEEDMLLYVDSMTSGEINCQIIGANKDLFVSMDDTPMSANKLLRPLNISQIVSNTTVTVDGIPVPVRYLLMQTDADADGYPSDVNRITLDSWQIFPALRLYEVMRVVMSSRGWSVISPVTTALQEYYIPCTNLHASNPFEYMLNAQITDSYSLTAGAVRSKVIEGWSIEENPAGTGRSRTLSESGTDTVMEYQALDTQICAVSVVVSCNAPFGTDLNRAHIAVHCALEDAAGEEINNRILEGYGTGDYLPNTNIDEQTGIARVILSRNAFTVRRGERLTCKITVSDQSPSGSGYIFQGQISAVGKVTFTAPVENTQDYGDYTLGAVANLFDCMNFDTQGDFVRAVIQTFALFPVFDYRTKTVTFETFQTVIDNKNAGNVMDWSDNLLQDDELEFSYQPDNFAKINEINFKKENDYQTGWTFRMHSASLEQGPEEYMEIPFASAKNITAWNLPLPVINVPLFTVDDSGNLKYEKTDTPYLVTPRSHLSFVSVGQGLTQASKTLYLAHFQYGGVKQNFDALTNAIAFPTVLRASFDLSLLDIYMIDFMKPVWLEQFSAYFYLLKVENYSGEIVTCEMIKLQ